MLYHELRMFLAFIVLINFSCACENSPDAEADPAHGGPSKVISESQPNVNGASSLSTLTILEQLNIMCEDAHKIKPALKDNLVEALKVKFTNNHDKIYDVSSQVMASMEALWGSGYDIYAPKVSHIICGAIEEAYHHTCEPYAQKVAIFDTAHYSPAPGQELYNLLGFVYHAHEETYQFSGTQYLLPSGQYFQSLVQRCYYDASETLCFLTEGHAPEATVRKHFKLLNEVTLPRFLEAQKKIIGALSSVQGLLQLVQAEGLSCRSDESLLNKLLDAGRPKEDVANLILAPYRDKGLSDALQRILLVALGLES